jgi:hypothetical protein
MIKNILNNLSYNSKEDRGRGDMELESVTDLGAPIQHRNPYNYTNTFNKYLKKFITRI